MMRETGQLHQEINIVMKQLEELKKKQVTHQQQFLHTPDTSTTNNSETLSNQGKLLELRHCPSILLVMKQV